MLEHRKGRRRHCQPLAAPRRRAPQGAVQHPGWRLTFAGVNDHDAQLFQGIGAIVVAGGHVEWAMQQLLLSLRGEGLARMADAASLTWTDLERKIRVAALGTPLGHEVLAALDLGEEQNLKARRDNAVHSYWAVDEQPGIRANRFLRREGGRIIVGNATDLFAAANLLFEQAARLRALTDMTGWPRMYSVPPPI